MKAGKAARRIEVTLSAAAEARAKVGVSQSAFAELLGVSLRTLQDWEQGRRRPAGAAQTLIKGCKPALRSTARPSGHLTFNYVEPWISGTKKDVRGRL